MLNDTRIEKDVQAALQADPRIHAPELIAVSADQIGTVVALAKISAAMFTQSKATRANSVSTQTAWHHGW